MIKHMVDVEDVTKEANEPIVGNIRFDGRQFKVILSEENTCIEDSYLIKDYDDMVAFIKKLRRVYPGEALAVNTRQMDSMCTEWRVHNLLYKLRIARNHTRSVDMEKNFQWYKVWIYNLLVLFA